MYVANFIKIFELRSVKNQTSGNENKVEHTDPSQAYVTYLFSRTVLTSFFFSNRSISFIDIQVIHKKHVLSLFIDKDIFLEKKNKIGI